MSTVTNEGGRKEILPAGMECRVYLNPFDPERMLVCDAQGRGIGIARRVQAACRRDTESAVRLHGEVRELARVLGQEAKDRMGASVVVDRMEDTLHNLRVIDRARLAMDADALPAKLPGAAVTDDDIRDLLS